MLIDNIYVLSKEYVDPFDFYCENLLDINYDCRGGDVGDFFQREYWLKFENNKNTSKLDDILLDSIYGARPHEGIYQDKDVWFFVKENDEYVSKRISPKKLNDFLNKFLNKNYYISQVAFGIK